MNLTGLVVWSPNRSVQTPKYGRRHQPADLHAVPRSRSQPVLVRQPQVDHRADAVVSAVPILTVGLAAQGQVPLAGARVGDKTPAGRTRAVERRALAVAAVASQPHAIRPGLGCADRGVAR
jgi:hypothetical protein